ncbi:unnamed protein product [Bursaphelenchus xylophilus]|uniref:(pine wood nematode) hypothetical protein n=1 Tax=Bursaphelenchus xylophilus TaxID=6326 RepID=A0A1I7SWY1_BURXY|nr:unnamed protein product [Bursaphelenchus xylophilus]CAG9100044.1 unnamed protein product [Bursaphelenchus xylophilus]
MLSAKARKAFRTVRGIKNSQMRTGNFSAFDFHRNLYKISPEAALCYLEMSYSIDDRVKKMDGEAADFVRLMKAIYIDGPWSAYERLSRVNEVPHALKSLSDTARSQIYKAFPNFKTLSNGNPRDQSARLMREIYSNRG